MRNTKSWILRTIGSLTLMALLAVPAVADDMITSGADLWQTAGSGATFSSFDDDPIPAGFFCEDSPAFTGKIVLEGAPLTTEPPGVLGYIDTVVHRLDDTTFDADGVAKTRVQLMAMSLVSPEPVDVGCDRPFNVAVSLDGEQPTTEMRIYREDEEGGHYLAPLALRVKSVFTPVGGDDSERRVISRFIELGAAKHSYWATTDRVGEVDGKPVLVDTDGDGVADSAMPGPSNFRTGVLPATTAQGPSTPPKCRAGECPYASCHCNPCSEDPFEPNDCDDPKHEHCIWTCVKESQVPFCVMPARQKS